MKLYIENCHLKKDKKLPKELEKDFEKLDQFYFSHCGYSYRRKCNEFYYYSSKKEKNDYLNSYSNFLSKLKEIINENIEDDIYSFISNYHVISNDDSRIYLMFNGKIAYYPSKVYEDYGDYLIIKNKTAKLLYPQFLSDDKINYMLENGKLPKGIYKSADPIYWSNRTKEISILDIEKMIKKSNIDKTILILRCILKESVFSNLNPKVLVTKDDEKGINKLLVLKISDSFDMQNSEVEKIIKNSINDYHNFIQNSILTKELSNIILKNILLKGKSINSEEKSLFKKLCEKEANNNNEVALYQIGYGYYYGDDFFEYNPVKAKKYLEKLISLGKIEPNIALGKLYYEGKIDGKPDYTKALEYFRVASDYGSEEATCIIGDMYLKGNEIIKINKDIAYNLYLHSFNNLFNEFLNGRFLGYFAETCLRLAKFFYDFCDEKNVEKAFDYIKLAKLASETRMQFDDSLENEKTDNDIKELYEKIKEDYIKVNKVLKSRTINYYSLFYGGYDRNTINVGEYKNGNETSVYITPKYHYFIIDNDNYELKLASSIKIKFNTTENNVKEKNIYLVDEIKDNKISENLHEFVMSDFKIEYKNKKMKINYF